MNHYQELRRNIFLRNKSHSHGDSNIPECIIVVICFFVQKHNQIIIALF
jgi:hypothetical protein